MLKLDPPAIMVISPSELTVFFPILVNKLSDALECTQIIGIELLQSLLRNYC